MNKQTIYKLLEEKALNYNDYADIPTKSFDEPFVSIKTAPNIRARQVNLAMQFYTGKKTYVRYSVNEKLKRAALLLAKHDPSLRLEILYGYRALEIQKQLFESNKTKLQSQYTGDALLAATHRLVAIPEVAGHPAGAAVDIHIILDGQPVDFGTAMWEFVPDAYTFSPFISKEAWNNRQLLRRIMMQVGFAPFDGEWWHFSYGDKEWAKYYAKGKAIYDQIDFRV